MKTARPTASSVYGELPALLFEMRQIIRQALPGSRHSDPNEWMRLQTMHFIARHGKPTMHELAEYLRIKAPSATSVVSYLVSHGMIERKAGVDRRVVHLSLTEEGSRLISGYGKQSEEMMRSAFSGLEEKEVCTLRDILSKMISCNKKKKL